jgi:hypothetical protein
MRANHIRYTSKSTKIYGASHAFQPLKHRTPPHLLGLQLQKSSHVVRTHPLERLTYLDNSGKLIWVYALGYVMAVDDIRVNLKNALNMLSKIGSIGEREQSYLQQNTHLLRD